MKITLISGSHRNNSQSSKVARFLQKQLEQTAESVQASIIDLADNPLPLWDQGVWEGASNWQELLTPLARQLADSDGFVVIAPEWHGQVPAGLKNFFLLFGKKELGHKPALIVGVSSGDGGAYPVAELRMSSYKNSRICYIPEHLIIRKVERVLNDDPQQNDPDADRYFRDRARWSLDILLAYAHALGTVRSSGVADSDQFRNGM
jgi:NAD(P)H-dependent FMN reductase